MTSTIPAPLSDLAAQISKLPGMGPKSAMRVVMTLLRWPEEQTRRLGASISSLRDQLHICRRRPFHDRCLPHLPGRHAFAGYPVPRH